MTIREAWGRVVRGALPMLGAALGCAAALMLVAGSESTQVALIERARLAFEKRGEPGHAEESAELYQRAEEENPSSYEAWWEGARACYYFGTRGEPAPADAEKRAAFADGIRRARSSISLRPGGAEGHFWLGVLLMSRAEMAGVLAELHASSEARTEWETCLRLDGSVEGFGPYRALGRLYFKLPGFCGGDVTKAREYLETAVRNAPSEALGKVYLAEVLRAQGCEADARRLLRQVLSMKTDARWAPEQPLICEKARRLLIRWDDGQAVGSAWPPLSGPTPKPGASSIGDP